MHVKKEGINILVQTTFGRMEVGLIYSSKRKKKNFENPSVQ